MSKVRNLPETTSLADNDLLYVVDVSEGPNGGKKVTKANLKASVIQTPAEIKTAYESNADTNAYTDAEKALVATVSNKLNKTGDTMSGNLNMATNKIQNLPEPLTPQEPATKNYVDSSVDALSWKPSVLDKDLSVPPVSPVAGQRYIVASPAVGLWFGQENNIAEWDGLAWKFLVPNVGDTIHVIDENTYYQYDPVLTLWERMDKTFSHSLVKDLTSDDHLQYLNRTGVRPMTGNLDMGGQNVINVNLVDGVDVSAHAARHNPGGADAIATASAVGLDASSTNTEGTATSVARSNHTHAIATGAPSTQIPDQTNAAGSSANLARADHQHNIPTDVATTISTSSTNTQGTAPAFARADHVHKVTIAYQTATATTDDTTTSTTDTLIAGMTLTPAAGTYLAIFSTTVLNSANGATRLFISIWSGGAQVAHSERNIGISGGANTSAHTCAVVTVDGTQAIEARWRAVAGTNTARQRSLTILRIG